MPWRRAACIASMATSGVVVGKRAENSAGVEPARAACLPKMSLPIDVARLELRGGGVAAIGTAQRAAHAESALGEIQAVAHRTAHAVVRHPRMSD